MFYLRRITSRGTVINQTLGDGYTMVSRFPNGEEFNQLFKAYFNRDHVADLDETADFDTKNVIAFVSTSFATYPIYQTEQVYIMTDSGKTFERL
jgi:hypothetical protein